MRSDSFLDHASRVLQEQSQATRKSGLTPCFTWINSVPTVTPNGHIRCTSAQHDLIAKLALLETSLLLQVGCSSCHETRNHLSTDQLILPRVRHLQHHLFFVLQNAFSHLARAWIRLRFLCSTRHAIRGMRWQHRLCITWETQSAKRATRAQTLNSLLPSSHATAANLEAAVESLLLNFVPLDLIGTQPRHLVPSKMGQLKRLPSNASGNDDRKMLAGGTCLGALIVFACLGPPDVVEVQPSAAAKAAVPALRALAPKRPALTSDAGGWHPINVFHGEVSGLKTGDKEWFSQVHEDQVILDLTGNDGCFMDLAANKAVKHSSAQALERRG